MTLLQIRMYLWNLKSMLHKLSINCGNCYRFKFYLVIIFFVPYLCLMKKTKLWLLERIKGLEHENKGCSENELVRHTLFEFQMLAHEDEIFIRQYVLGVCHLKISGLISPLDCCSSLLAGLQAPLLISCLPLWPCLLTGSFLVQP